jgi:hypothetical protein
MALRVSCLRLLAIIHDVHHDIPNKDWHHPQVKFYMYYPSFLRWVYVKSTEEMKRRDLKPKDLLQDKFIALRSRNISDFIPPNDAEIAEDVVWLLEKWKWKYFPGGTPLPISYIELVKELYGYNPKQESSKRVDQVSGHHRDADREWYHLEGEAAAQVAGYPLGEGVRRSGNEGR